MTRRILIAALIAFSAASLAAEMASAKSGGGHGMSNHSGTSAPRVQPKADRPTVNFTKMKLVKCHKYARGNGQGGVNWVTVCS